MIALIDGDVILYRCGFASENDPEEIACMRAHITVEDTLRATAATEYQVWLSAGKEKNFRYAVDPQYKANRTKPRPKWYDSIKLFLQTEWKAQISEDQEADDELGIRQCGYQEDAFLLSQGSGEGPPVETIICTIDKDLKMIPGLHYNFVTKEFAEVDYMEGLKFFYAQLLIGDRTDNVFGVDGIGKVKAHRLLKECETEPSMFSAVRSKYNNDARLLKNGRLLWIRREPNEMWQFPNGVDLHYSSGEQSNTVILSSDGGTTTDRSILLGEGMDTGLVDEQWEVSPPHTDSTGPTGL